MIKNNLLKLVTLTTAMAFAATASAGRPAAEIDKEAAEYTSSLNGKGIGDLSIEAGIEFGITLANCGTDAVSRSMRAVSESTDQVEFRKNLDKIEISDTCKLSSIKLGIVSARLKRISSAAYNAFMKEIESRY